MWGLGCLVWESFNGPLRARGNLKDLEHVRELSFTLKVV
jgi:SCY1-like protein 1